ncbi:MAG: Protein of unknown function (DUF3306) [Roseibaca calidilacus]|uniref:DUF3306 domain-containing protein n=1 Tax=Roseibaca calidilacus TaxID=1666912 RepID=A0A0P7WZ15_9RHOB|nr:DUF3306 domain-containing protein [Roseibaca calidilacus]KPP92820.1 MAG: Protein of unknown function (DUF3306) [Roseibaca calidilacus]CUX80108.1 Protein of unknown function (DUF3306) [Roseibaca calidilacus]
MAQGPKDDESGFFNRWSQRKQQATREEMPQPSAEKAPESDVPRPEDVPSAAPELTEDELAALPAIDDLTPQSDIRVFMRAGVPKSLRNAALRKMWLITPAIRDHVDPAVDYAWDWNTPGGVPGDGIAPSPERAAQMLRDLFKPRNDTAPEAPESNAEDLPVAEDPAPERTEPQIMAQAGPDAVRKPDAAVVIAPKAEKDAPSPTEEERPAPRRHGGALPE